MIFGIVLLFGLIIGSFLNVCIARLPLEAIHRQSSFPLSPLQNSDPLVRQIPLVSFACPSRQVPDMRPAHILALSPGGTAERLAVSSGRSSEFGFTGEALAGDGALFFPRRHHVHRP